MPLASSYFRAMGTYILLLPDELLAYILDHTSPLDVGRCHMTCRTICDLVKGSAHMQYRMELFKAGMAEGTRGDLSYNECLHALRRREQSWQGLDWHKRVIINLSSSSDALFFRLDDGLLHTFEQRSDGTFRTAHSILPCSENSEVPSDVDCDVHCSDLWVEDIYTDSFRDLLVLVELTRDNPSLVYKLHLRTLSTNLPHTAAWNPLLVKHSETNSDSSSNVGAYVQGAGDHIGILVINVDGAHTGNIFDLWNWRTGINVNIPCTPQAWWTSFLFLDTDTLLLCSISEQKRHSSGSDNDLQVYTLSGNSSGCTARHAVSYNLPSPQPSASYVNIFIQNNKSHVRSGPSHRQIYSSDSNHSIIALKLFLVNQDPSVGKEHILVVDRNFLVSDTNLRLHDSSSGIPIRVPWDHWGPPATRVLSDPSADRIWTAFVHGGRYASLPLVSDGMYSLTVYDFNTRQRPIQLTASGMERRGSTNTVKVIKESVIQDSLFAHPVRTSLPYFKVSTEPLFDWMDILMDEERIVGIKRHELDVAAEVLVM